MAATLEELQGKVVSVITGDGRNIVGNLKGYDHTINLILEQCHERIFSPTAGCEQDVRSELLATPLEDTEHGWGYVNALIRSPSQPTSSEPQEISPTKQPPDPISPVRVPSLSSAVIGELDEELDGSMDLSQIRAKPLKGVAH